MPANNAKSKHSAAPWELKMLTGMGGPQAVIKKLPRGIDQFICLFVRSSGLTAEEQLANAKLIARAPALLRCLNQLNNSLYRVEGDPEDVLRINHDVTKPVAALLGELEEQS